MINKPDKGYRTMSSLFKISTLSIGILSSFLITACSTAPLSSSAKSNEQVIIVNTVSPQGVGNKIGTIAFQDSPAGLVINTDLTQLPPGPHGFHIHEKGSCDAAEKDGKMVAALAAGSHHNPSQVPHHGTPVTGHLGDLPVLNVQNDGTAKETLIAPRLSLADVQGLAIMVHAGGDNYSDEPKPLGGGGDRIACGLIK
jgi:superoxide dismutase, Cu-Zn family